MDISPVNNELPWQQSSWLNLKAYIDASRIPDGLLLSGPPGIGKFHLAMRFAASLLCFAPLSDSRPCGDCKGCKLRAANTHPDLICINPADKSETISVDVVRGVISRLSLKPQYHRSRVLVIAQADRMTVSAANSLLKTLEEPAAQTVIVLLSAVPATLPATITSRCHRVKIPPANYDLAKQWLTGQGVSEQIDELLAIANCAPLRALELNNSEIVAQRRQLFEDWCALANGEIDSITVAETWSKEPLRQVIDNLYAWLVDMIRLRVGRQDVVVQNRAIRDQLHRHARQLFPRELFKYLDIVVDARRMLTSQMNNALLLESLFIQWSQLKRTLSSNG